MCPVVSWALGFSNVSSAPWSRVLADVYVCDALWFFRALDVGNAPGPRGLSRCPSMFDVWVAP